MSLTDGTATEIRNARVLGMTYTYVIVSETRHLVPRATENSVEYTLAAH